MVGKRGQPALHALGEGDFFPKRRRGDRLVDLDRERRALKGALPQAENFKLVIEQPTTIVPHRGEVGSRVSEKGLRS